MPGRRPWRVRTANTVQSFQLTESLFRFQQLFRCTCGVNVVLGVMCECWPGGGIRNCDRRKTEQQVGNVRWKRRNGRGCGRGRWRGGRRKGGIEGCEAGGLAQWTWKGQLGVGKGAISYPILSYTEPCWDTPPPLHHPTELCCTLLNYAAPS